MTVVCSCNAGGDYVPPFIIFPSQRMLSELLHGCPPGTDAVARKNGWMITETFIIYLAHFVKFVRCSDESKVLLLVDNHVSHISSEAINLCRSHGIVMLGFPPHMTHKLQPLDVSFFGSLKKFYSQQCDSWMVSHPRNVITDRQVAQLLGGAYKKAATAGNAINGCSACGIEPFNDDVFDDSDFAACITTEHGQPLVVEPATPVRHNEEIAGLVRFSEDANNEGAVLVSNCDHSDAASDRRISSIDEDSCPCRHPHSTKTRATGEYRHSAGQPRPVGT